MILLPAVGYKSALSDAPPIGSARVPHVEIHADRLGEVR
jgi:hypothetical protein